MDSILQKAVLQTVAFIILLWGNCASAIELPSNIDQKNSTNKLNYLYILVHGMGGSSSSFDYAKTKAYDYKNTNENNTGDYTFMEYMAEQYQLAGHVFAYTFSHSHGNPSILKKELGGHGANNFDHTAQLNYFRMAATNPPAELQNYITGEEKNKKTNTAFASYNKPLSKNALTMLAFDPITQEVREYYASYNKDAQDNAEFTKIQKDFGLVTNNKTIIGFLAPTGIEVLPGNNWIKQAKRDFKKLYATNPELKNRLPGLMKQIGRSIDITKITTANFEDILDEVVPQDLVFIAHSMGNLDVRQYLTSTDYEPNTVKKIISLDGVHLGSDALRIKYLQNGLFNGAAIDAVRAYIQLGEDYRKNVVPVLNATAFVYHLLKLRVYAVDSPPNPMSDEDVMTAALLMYLGFSQTQDSMAPWVMMGANIFGTYETDITASHIDDPSWKAMDVMNDNSLANQMRDENFKEPQDQAIKFRFINPRGIPTHQARKGRAMHGISFLPYIHMLLATTDPEFQALPTIQSKLMATMMMMVEPDSYLIQDGSFAVPKYSSDAQGVAVVERPNVKNQTMYSTASRVNDIIRYDMPYIDENIDYLLSDILLVKRLADLAYSLTAMLTGGSGVRAVYLLPIVYGGAKFIDINLYAEMSQTKGINGISNLLALEKYLQNTKSMLFSHTTVVKDSINFDKGMGNGRLLYGKLEPPIIKALSDAPEVRADQFYERHNERFFKTEIDSIAKRLQYFSDVMGGKYQEKLAGSMSNGATIGLGSFKVDPQKFMEGNFNFKGIDLSKIKPNPTVDDFRGYFKKQVQDSMPIPVPGLGYEPNNLYPKSLQNDWNFRNDVGANENTLYLAQLPLDSTSANAVIDVTGELSPNGIQAGPYPQTYFDKDGKQNFYMNFQGYLNEQNEMEVYGTVPTLDYQIDPDVMGSNTNGTVAIAMPGIREGVRPKSITLKTDKTIISGTLDDFDPKRMKQFQFSLNFGPWQDILVRDDYGHYQIGPLLLAEGQNILTFRGENSAGHRNWQMLRIIRSSTPLLPSSLTPEHQQVVNQKTVTVSVQYNDTQFEAHDAAGQIIFLDSFKVGGVEIPTSHVMQNVTWNVYKYTANLSTTLNLPEGSYDVEVRAHDVYNHTSYARWSFAVDTTPPTIAFKINPAYPGSSTLNLSFNVTDNAANFAYNAHAFILNAQDQVIATLNVPTQFSMGNQNLDWDGIQHIGPPTKSVDGIYKLSISLRDKAGNLASATRSFVLDSAPPHIISAQFDHPVFSRKYPQGLNLALEMNEAGKVVVQFTQENSQLTQSFLMEIGQSQNNIYQGNYRWNFNGDANTIPDGTYVVKIIPLDTIFQQGEAVTLSVLIDRTGPSITNTHVSPLVLANNGLTPYQADLQFTVSEKVLGNIQLSYKQNNQIIQTWSAYPAVIGNNTLHFNLGDTTQPQGLYAMKIEFSDIYGNTSNVVADVIKDGIPPIVNFPQSDAVIADTVTLIGVAQDPNWTNSQDFERYEVYVANGAVARPSNLNALEAEWKTVGVAVPLANQNDYSKPYQSVRPISQSSPIAFIDPQTYADGTITVLVRVAEKGLGFSAGTVRTLQIDKTQSDATLKPAIDLIIPTKNINLSLHEQLNFTVLNSQAPANIEMDIFDATQTPVYHRSFGNIPGSHYFGKPQIDYGRELGGFLWQDETGFHLVLNGDDSPHNFKGNVLGGDLKLIKHNFKAGEITFNRTINFEVPLKAGEFRTLDFTVGNLNQTLYFSFLLDNAIPNANLLKLGKSKTNPPYVPAQLSLKPAQESILQLAWDGKLQNGGLGPNGNYLIKISASGTNGLGFTQASSTFNVKSNFDLQIASITPANKNIDPFGTIDRIGVDFILNKDSYVTAKVFDAQNNTEVITLKNNALFLGQTSAHSLMWNGAYPNIYSQARKVSGNFYIQLKATPKDELAISKNIRISNITLSTHSTGGNTLAQLNLSGTTVNYNGDLVHMVLGNNQYSWSLFATGDYFPPKGFNYQLEGSGLQSVTIHPFVPFAGLAHRSFDTVKIKVKADVTQSFNYRTWGNCLFGVCTGESYRNANQRIVIGLNDNQNTYINQTCQKQVCSTNLQPGPPTCTYVPNYEQCDQQVPMQTNRSTSANSEVNASFFATNFTNQGACHNTWPVAHQITIYSESGKYLDVIKPLEQNCSSGCWATSEKGIFKAYIDISYRDYCGMNYSVKVQPEQDIKYSRLTNRFYPWYGYVHKSPQNTVQYTYDFSSEFNNEFTLGFLGINHMNGWNEELKAGYSGSFDSNLFPQNQAERNQMISSFQNMYHNFEYKWVTEDATYREYLDGEHFEFIPITSPMGGDFVTITGKHPTFKTARMVYTQYKQTMNLKWPAMYQEVESLNNQQLLHINQKLKEKDIETFDLNNPIYQIDLNSVSYLEPNGSYQFIQGGIYKDTGYESQKLSQLFPLPKNVIQSSVVMSVTGNSAIDVTVRFKENGGSSIPYSSDSSIEAVWNGNFVPVAWSSDLDPVLGHGVLDSQLVTFNATDFQSYSPDLIFAEAYPYQQQTDLTFTAPYLFYKHDRNNPNSGQILNPNIRYNPWQIKIYDITGSSNAMFEVANVKQDPKNIMGNSFKAKLRLDATERRYAQIFGKAASAFELLYFDGNTWKSITKSNQAKNGRLAFWDISRLNGKVTLALRVSENNQLTTRTQEVYVGQLVKRGDASPQNLTVQSPYKRAKVYFHPQSFNQDTFVSVTPVQLSELNLETRPEIYSVGPIAEILPHGVSFNNGSNGLPDTRPTLVFLYSHSDIQELLQQGIDVNKLNVYYIGERGALELAANTHSWVTGNSTNDPDGNLYSSYHQITAKLDHFSPYTLLEGEIYPKPSVHASQKNARMQNIVIYGQSQPNQKLLLYLDDDATLGDQDLRNVSYQEQAASLGDWIMSNRKFGEDYLATLSPAEKNKILQQRENAVTQNNADHQKEQSLENLWQQEYNQMQQSYLNQLNNAISYTLDQPIYSESAIVTRNIQYNFKDENGKMVTVSSTVIVDPNLFGVGKFTTRNIQLIGMPNSALPTQNHHEFRSIKAIDYSALNKKIKIAQESWNVQGHPSLEYRTQSDSDGNYRVDLQLPAGVSQNHVFVTYEKTALAKNRAIAHMIVGYDKDLPVVTSANISPQNLNAANTPWSSTFQIQASEYGKVGITKIDPTGKTLETIFQNCEPGQWINWEWKFDTADRDGVYRYAIFAIDESGNTSLPINGQISLDRYPPVIRENLTLKAFNPINKKFTLNLNSNEFIGRYDLKILNPSGQVVHAESITQNPAISQWKPNPAENLQYSYFVTAYDQGLNSVSVTGTVSIDTQTPSNPSWLKINNLGSQFFVQASGVSDSALVGYSLKRRSTLDAAPSAIDFKNTPSFLSQNLAGDRFYYYSIAASDWAGNESPTPIEKAIYSDVRATFIELPPTQSSVLKQDGFEVGVPTQAGTSVNFYMLQHLKPDNTRPYFNYSGLTPMPDMYRAEYAYPITPTLFDFAMPYDATQSTRRQLSPAQFRLFRHNGLHWLEVKPITWDQSQQLFKGSVSELGYFVLALPQTTLFNDGIGPNMSFERLANNNLVPSDLVITANITDSDTAIDPASFKFTLDDSSYRVSDRNFKVSDSYGRTGVLRIDVPKLTGHVLTPGTHTITLEAQDLAGNVSRKTITVKNINGFAIENPLNYPNPVRGGATKFSFQLSKPASEVIIRVFSTTGKLLQEINAGPALVGYNEVPWNVFDRFGQYLANDVYIYVVIARSLDGERQTAKGKLMVLQ